MSKNKVDHYCLISTTAVYERLDLIDLDENSTRLKMPKGFSPNGNEKESYGARKSKCEEVCINILIKDKITFNGRLNSIKRCINNILNNAVSYGKEINVIIKKTMNNIVIFIDDDGPGIPDREKENVLKPFYRMDESRSQNKSGVGLGLSIASDIVRSHGGNILLETSPQKGLRVKISLPF